ncbi:MAG: hypothetical protein KAR20_24265 [Candidatus Heimdallarchaeota archaeon]|nr:hypothetical protein [Candidatus Heimdallarchaeota archaeon]
MCDKCNNTGWKILGHDGAKNDFTENERMYMKSTFCSCSIGSDSHKNWWENIVWSMDLNGKQTIKCECCGK